jgi:hypothetical protein
MLRLKAHDATLYFKCFRCLEVCCKCFIWMLQWLYTYVAIFCFQCFICFPDICCKCVYLDVAYVSHICLQVFLFRCYICFCNGFHVFSGVFSSVSYACFNCLSAFRRMLQVLHLNVSKVDWVLHLPHRLLLPRFGVSPPAGAGWASTDSFLSFRC